MRFTCLKCGHQFEPALGAGQARTVCVCGHEYTSPNVVDTGVRPNSQAADKLRGRAFRAAGVVKNFGGFALGIALLGVLFFPLALVGAGIGIYVLTMLRGAVRRYSGRPQAIFAVVFGVLIFFIEGALWMRWLDNRRHAAMVEFQDGAREDLKRLLRAERLYRAENQTYGSFDQFSFRPSSGRYTIYLSADDFIAATRDGETITDPLPTGLTPNYSVDTFTAVAVANIDRDEKLDVWVLTHDKAPRHLSDDTDNSPMPNFSALRVEPPAEKTVEASVGVDVSPPSPDPESVGAGTLNNAGSAEVVAPTPLDVSGPGEVGDGRLNEKAPTEEPRAEEKTATEKQGETVTADVAQTPTTSPPVEPSPAVAPEKPAVTGVKPAPTPEKAADEKTAPTDDGSGSAGDTPSSEN